MEMDGQWIRREAPVSSALRSGGDSVLCGYWNKTFPNKTKLHKLDATQSLWFEKEKGIWQRRMNYLQLRRPQHWGYWMRSGYADQLIVSRRRVESKKFIQVCCVLHMGPGTAWGGRLPCKEDIQVGSIPTRSSPTSCTSTGCRMDTGTYVLANATS